MQEWEDLEEELLERGERPAFLDLPFEQWPLWCHQRLIEQPEALVEKARALLSSEKWEEVVVGLTLVTGRCVPEILKTGVLFPKERYSLLFTAHLEQIDEVVGPFELPTLVEAEQVFLAWQRVRGLFDCAHLVASQICRIYRPQVCAVAREHFAELLLIDAHGDGYTPMLRCIYARIAAHYYCPVRVVGEWFMDLVQGFEWGGRDDCVERSWCEDCRRESYVYAISNGAGNIDGRQAIKLELPGYDVLDCLKECRERDNVEGKISSPAVQMESLIQDRDGRGGSGGYNPTKGESVQGSDCPSASGHVWWQTEVKDAIAADQNIDGDWGGGGLEVLCLAMSMGIGDMDGNIDRHQGIKLGEPGVRVPEVFKETIRPPEETEEEQMEEEALDDDCCEIAVLNETRARFDQVAQQLGTLSDEETLVALLSISDQRRAVIDQVLFELREEFKQARESKERNSSEEERSVADEEEDDDERGDREVNILIDTYEQQGYGVHVYFSQWIMQMLEPLAKEFGTSTPIPTLQALVAAYRARARLDQEGVEPLEGIHAQEEDDEEIMEGTDDRVLVEIDGLVDGHHSLRPGAPSVEMFHQGGEEEEQQEVLSEPESDARRCANVSLKVDDPLALTRGSVQEAEEGVSTLSTQRELGLVQRLLACFIFEIQVNVIENEPPMEILDTLATLADHAPPEVLKLVEHLRRTPPEEQEEDYPDILPSFVNGDR